MTASVDDIKKLRNMTGAGVLDCREALEGADGDVEKAVVLLREKGLSKAAKRADREAHNGRVELYSHGDGRIGVMVEVNCETDFVAKNKDFQELTHDLAMHIAALNPEYVSCDEIDFETINNKKTELSEEVKKENKPLEIVEKIVEGKVKKHFDEICLMSQTFVKNSEMTIGELMTEKIAKLGENIKVKKFVRFEI